MICALTVRRIKPGTFEEFREAFTRGWSEEDALPERWVRFHMLRNADDPDEVISFGFFDGSVDELRAYAAEHGYSEQLAAIAPFVDSVGTDGLFEIAEEQVAAA